VQTAETFKVIREILTCWYVLENVCGHVKPLVLLRPLIILVTGKTDHH